ncbi:MAG: hypothetical protein ACTS6P_01770 [Candidatus Hodgkinia cicadicola]
MNSPSPFAMLSSHLSVNSSFKHNYPINLFHNILAVKWPFVAKMFPIRKSDRSAEAKRRRAVIISLRQ